MSRRSPHIVLELDLTARARPGSAGGSASGLAQVHPRLRMMLVAEDAHGDAASTGSMAAAAFVGRVKADTDAAEGVESASVSLAAAASAADEALRRGRAPGSDAAAMLVAAVFVPGSIVVVRSGEGRCYRVRDGVLQRLGLGDDVPASLQSTVDAQERTTMPSTSTGRADGALDGGDRRLVVPYAAEYAPGDAYLLCSASLCSVLDEAVIARHCRGRPDAASIADGLLAAQQAVAGLDGAAVAVGRLAVHGNDD